MQERKCSVKMKNDSTSAVVFAQNLTKVFRDFWRRPHVHAVDGIDFRVRKGEVFGLLGPNGSGKSTTIKLILGLLHPTRGRLQVWDESPNAIRIKERIGYLPEESYLYPYLTAEETLRFYAHLFTMNTQQRKERIEQLLEMMGLCHARHRAVGEFSKGMARRIGLAQALINDPDLIILDEPTSGLDPLGCRQVKDLILTLAKWGKTILLSSHLLGDVEDVCDRMAILYNGKIVVTGSKRDLLEERNRQRLTFSNLSPKAMYDLLDTIKERLDVTPEIDHAQRGLEQFFIEVVNKAKEKTTNISGVSPTQSQAEYLFRDGSAKP